MLVDKAREIRLEKQAGLFGVLGGHIAQNVIGTAVAKSPKFKKGLAESALMGVMGKKAPRTVKSVSKDAVSAVAVPERNMIRNEMYGAGRDLAKKHNIDTSKMSKRDLATARVALRDGSKGLRRIGQNKNLKARALAIHRTKLKGVDHKDLERIARLPSGKRPPSSTKVGIAANAAIAPVAPDLAALNATKIAGGTEKANANKYVKKIKDKLTINPIKKAFKSGEKGSKFNHASNKIEGVMINPFLSEAQKDAYKMGKSKVSKANDMSRDIKKATGMDIDVKAATSNKNVKTLKERVKGIRS